MNAIIGAVSRKLPVSWQYKRGSYGQNDERADLLGTARVVHPRGRAYGQLQRRQRRERSEDEDDGQGSRREESSKDTRLR